MGLLYKKLPEIMKHGQNIGHIILFVYHLCNLANDNNIVVIRPTLYVTYIELSCSVCINKQRQKCVLRIFEYSAAYSPATCSCKFSTGIEREEMFL
jgi:hypothetical protein